MSDPRIGKTGVARVEWPSGQTTETEGKVIAIDEAENEVYLESQYGPVVGHLDTLDVFED